MSTALRNVITALATCTAVLVERSYFDSWGWPMVREVSWAVIAVALLGFIVFRFSYAVDNDPSTGWSVVAYCSSFLAAGLAAGGLMTGNDIFLMLITLLVALFWIASLLEQAFISSTDNHNATTN